MYPAIQAIPTFGTYRCAIATVGGTNLPGTQILASRAVWMRGNIPAVVTAWRWED
jgi:hypothetical protein